MKIWGINSVNAQLKKSWFSSPREGLSRVLQVMQDQEWHEVAPMLSWVIKHPRAGIILVDAGEQSRALDWSRYPVAPRMITRNMLRFPETFQSPLPDQLKNLGIKVSDVQHIIVTHLHQDHVGHLSSFPKAKVWVSRAEFEATQKPFAHMKGYWPSLFPERFRPDLIDYRDGAFHNFESSRALFEDIWIVPTPGHSPGHQSVIVKSQGRFVVLAGDVTPAMQYLERESVDMISAMGEPQKARQSKQKMVQFIKDQNALYLPSHCPTSLPRLEAFKTQKTLA
ncbi:N-acyl homoserine lactonase family protein [Deinococcus roseus]|uniref:N-acyl homoserine lactonase family protein n=1 Tax=Deinococcus roseus TaxID=392414 RepID=A0ABQ2CUK8_9DEIO|nr:N-acyl homoserine lactonase family protein [Deinococcus roseus]GGJ22056.1 N-acyl homoserine lactonase family protein [Deinococcus roseus]